MAVQHGRENIRVNAIAPGFLYTPMVAPLLTEETRELRCRAAPLGTEGTAWDVAWAAVFLASEEARVDYRAWSCPWTPASWRPRPSVRCRICVKSDPAGRRGPV